MSRSGLGWLKSAGRNQQVGPGVIQASAGLALASLEMGRLTYECELSVAARVRHEQVQERAGPGTSKPRHEYVHVKAIIHSTVLYKAFLT